MAVKIVQLLPELNEGGVERGVVELNREMVLRGITSTVISAGGKMAAQIELDGGQHVSLDVCSKNILTAPLRIYRLRKVLQRLNPDILHARSRVPAWLTYLANKKLQLPFVTTVHGFNSVNIYSRVMTFGNPVVCVSDAIKDYIQNHYQVPDHKITVIPRGVDLDMFNPEKVDQDFIQHFKGKYKLDGRFVVTAVGRITQLKDLETFIRGVAVAKKQIPNICGLIVGGVRQDKQNYFESLQKLVAELRADEYIHFVGSQSKVAEIYSLSAIVAICSNKPESFGRTAAESLAMNVPVLATNHGGILDMVKDGVTGGLFPVGAEAVFAKKICFLRNSCLTGMRPMIKQKFSLGKMVESTLDVYRDLLKKQ